MIAIIGTSTIYAQSERYIEVNGNASAMVEPNKAEILISLSEADSKGKTTMATLESQLAKALQQAGIDVKKQLVITGQSSAAQKKSKSYLFKNYRLTVSSAEEAETVFNALGENSIQNATLNRVWNDKLKDINDSLKVEAFNAAKANAQLLAKTAGQPLGGVLMINCYSYDNDFSAVVNDRMLSTKSVSEGGDMELGSVGFQKIKVQQNITVRFELLINKE